MHRFDFEVLKIIAGGGDRALSVTHVGIGFLMFGWIDERSFISIFWNRGRWWIDLLWFHVVWPRR